VEGLANGSLRPIIAVEIPLKDASRAHEVVMEAGHHGKVVLVLACARWARSICGGKLDVWWR